VAAPLQSTKEKEQKMSELNQRHLKLAIDAGCTNGYVNKDGWVVAFLPAPKASADVIIRKLRDGGYRAWVVVNGSPKAITRHVGSGTWAPQHAFNTIRKAVQGAIANPFF
jgi:hypothetical protein